MKVRRALVASWKDRQAGREALAFLYGLGLGPGLASRVWRAFGSAAPAVVREDPYRLSREVFGIGFASADRIAQALGIPRDDRRLGEHQVVLALLGDRPRRVGRLGPHLHRHLGGAEGELERLREPRQVHRRRLRHHSDLFTNF
jgi:hypothetical protein